MLSIYACVSESAAKMKLAAVLPGLFKRGHSRRQISFVSIFMRDYIDNTCIIESGQFSNNTYRREDDSMQELRSTSYSHVNEDQRLTKNKFYL